MSTLFPILAVLLALIAAGSIAYIAWELSSEKFHAELEGEADDSDPSDQP